jgi:hypothetical protein
MKTLKLLIWFVLFAVVTSTCSKLREECPHCNEDATWTKYGNVEMDKTGYDGALDESLDGTHIEYDCGWQIYQGHAGGIGNTYEVTSCHTSVVLIWMNGVFSAMELNENWEGSLNDSRGSIKMGCTLKDFLKIYPEFKAYPQDPSSFFSLGGARWVKFDEKEKLIYISSIYH